MVLLFIVCHISCIVGQPIIFTSNYKNENPENLNLVVTDKESRVSYTCFVDIVDSDGIPLNLEEFSVPELASESESESPFNEGPFSTSTTSSTTSASTDEIGSSTVDSKDSVQKTIADIKRGKFASLRDKLISQSKQQSDHHRNSNNNKVSGSGDKHGKSDIKTILGDWRRSCTLATFGKCIISVLVWCLLLCTVV